MKGDTGERDRRCYMTGEIFTGNIDMFTFSVEWPPLQRYSVLLNTLCGVERPIATVHVCGTFYYLTDLILFWTTSECRVKLCECGDYWVMYDGLGWSLGNGMRNRRIMLASSTKRDLQNLVAGERLSRKLPCDTAFRQVWQMIQVRQ